MLKDYSDILVVEKRLKGCLSILQAKNLKSVGLSNQLTKIKLLDVGNEDESGASRSQSVISRKSGSLYLCLLLIC